jgi:tRNA-specific 2-thiouridylase
MARIAVLMSGGIDSSGAAALLMRAGHEIAGITALMSPAPPSGAEAVYRARRVCDRLRVPHIVLDLTGEFHRQVLEPFIEGYLEGLTPNPCACCNREIKLGRMLELALRCGFERVATGHYARLASKRGRLLLCEPVDTSKSQTYFLALVRPEVLPSLELPLAGVRKSEVRELVHDLGLRARNGESQDLCFVPSGAYHDLISDRSSVATGGVIDTEGRIVGTHKGHYAYTVGQRFGLRGRRWYVLEKQAHSNQIVIGERCEALRRCIKLKSVNYFAPPSEFRDRKLRVKYRYNTPAVEGRVGEATECGLTVITNQPCFAPAPGQILACYRDGCLVFGGIIASAE